MVDRVLVRLEDVASLSNLSAAFWRAARGKRRFSEVTNFAANLDRELACLSEEILAGTVPVGCLRTFEIRDPKRRTIHAPAFRERVLHHALMAHVGPVLERSLLDNIFACREGKGSLAAVLEAQRLARRYPVFAKLDVRAYFASIDHAVLRALLRRRIRGRGVLLLLDRIVESHRSAPGRGLPIGALSSQHFANLYLGGLDRWLVEECRLGLVRYMDDLVIWGDSAGDLRHAAEGAVAYAREHLRLDLDVVIPPTRSAYGVPFCGFRVFSGRLLLSRRRRRRYASARRCAEDAYTLGLLRAGDLQRATTAAIAITAHADAHFFRSADLVRRPAPDA